MSGVKYVINYDLCEPEEYAKRIRRLLRHESADLVTPYLSNVGFQVNNSLSWLYLLKIGPNSTTLICNEYYTVVCQMHVFDSGILLRFLSL